MRFKPIPDSVRCAALEARWLTVVRCEDGSWKCYATDSEYVQRAIVEPACEELEAHIFYTEEP